MSVDTMNLEVIKADYFNKRHEEAIVLLLDAYASDPMGGGKPLDNRVKDGLVKALARLPQAFSILAFVDGQPTGLVNCLEGFSTFACKPLINIHDITVLKPFRRQGIGQQMLSKVEEIARSRGCCKLTLEVLSNNEVAKSVYAGFGFSGYQLDPKLGVALFWEKTLTSQ